MTGRVVGYTPSNSTQAVDLYVVELADGLLVHVNRDQESTWVTRPDTDDEDFLDTEQGSATDEAVADFDDRVRSEYRKRGIWALMAEAEAAALVDDPDTESV